MMTAKGLGYIAINGFPNLFEFSDPPFKTPLTVVERVYRPGRGKL